MNIKSFAQKTISELLTELNTLPNNINDDFENLITRLLSLKGKIIFTGVGKSAIIAKKIVATMVSTGTKAHFLNPTDAVHGDLGIVENIDFVIFISKSGNTTELKTLLPILGNMTSGMACICGNADSYLVKNTSFFVNTTISKEICPNNLAPTTSTAAQLIMGDLIAVCLQKLNNFTAQDFGKFHPGGTLGMKLNTTVNDIIDSNQKPFVDKNATLKEVIISISKSRFGLTVVLENGKIIGIITDGDLRRMLLKSISLENIFASDIMTRNPKKISGKILISQAIEQIKSSDINQFLVEDNGEYLGVLDIHDLIKDGIL